MLSVDVTLFWWSLVGFGLASLIHIIHLVASNNRIDVVATIVMALSFVFLTVAIIMRALHVGHLPVANMFEYLSIFAWAAAFFYFVFKMLFKHDLVGIFIAPVVFMLIVTASLLPKAPNEQLVPALQSAWLQIHVTLAALSEAAFGVAFAANCMFFIKKIISGGAYAARFPSYERLDTISHKAIVIGYPLFTVGALFAGAIWAEQAWGTFWSWDPKEVWSLIVWIIYTLYFHVRFLRGWRGGKSALISIIGFIAALLTFFSNMFTNGLHSYS